MWIIERIFQSFIIFLILNSTTLVFAENKDPSNTFQVLLTTQTKESYPQKPTRTRDAIPTSLTGIGRNNVLADVESQSHLLESKPVTSRTWRILKTEWTDSDEKGFAEFVKTIGESGCRTMHSCLTNQNSNPAYYASNPRGVRYYADCADLPYVLRSYYAWKNGLPFSYSTSVRPLGLTRDIRYTARGNSINSRKDLIQSFMNGPREIRQIVDTISSAHYRIPANNSGRLLSDHYSVKISRESIRPGTIIYDANGHVAVVYKVTDKGRIHYIDSHPDNSLTRGIYGRKFARSNPSMGAGFKRWRPIKLVGAARLEDGSYSGGTLTLASNKDLEDWSEEQYFGNAHIRPRNWRHAKFILNGKPQNYYDFVRIRLASENFKYDPIGETRSLISALCEDIKYRADAVNLAITLGIHRKAQPSRLPRNIYGTEGTWEIYSTPSRDARLKTSFKELRDEIVRFLKLAQLGDSNIDYSGGNLKFDLLRVYDSEAHTCKIQYKKSNGMIQELSLSDIAGRLFKISFDPYHCIERRWGATDEAELASCTDGIIKTNWYIAEQRLRNQIHRTYDKRMDFSLDELRRALPGSGVDMPPDIDVHKVLQ